MDKMNKESEPERKIESRYFNLFRRYWELWFFLGYLIFLSVRVFPGLRWDYDIGHHTTLLMSSLRIWAGQVPYRDFYPWYGPLFHYFLALGVGLAGNDLYAVKLFLQFISPILCMAILIWSLRMLKLPPFSRFFILIATFAFRLDRVQNEIRALFPVLLIALWYRGYQKKQKLSYGLIFPLAVLAFFFSAEIGIYLLPAALVFAALGFVFAASREERAGFGIWALSGALASGLILTVLFLRTIWLKNYLSAISGLMDNFRWSSGMSLPDLHYIREEPLEAFYYVPLLIYALAGGSTLCSWGKGKLNRELHLWMPTLLVFGVMLWLSAITRTSPSHLQYALLPALIIAGMALPQKFRPWHPLKLTSLAALAAFLITGASFCKYRFQPIFHEKNYAELMGVRIAPEEKMVFDKIKSFAAARGRSEIGFPLKSFYYGFLGMVPSIPFEGPESAAYPGNGSAYKEAIMHLNAQYMILDERDMFWSIPGEVTDALLDYLEENYQPIVVEGPLWIFQKLDHPRSLFHLMSESDSLLELTRKNSFQFTVAVPQNLIGKSSYLEFQAEFVYDFPLGKRFSLPMVECKFDERKWVFFRPEDGQQRINNTRGFHPFRTYIRYPARELNFQIDFPGALNFPPSRILVKNFKWYQLAGKIFPRVHSYQLEEASQN